MSLCICVSSDTYVYLPIHIYQYFHILPNWYFSLWRTLTILETLGQFFLPNLLLVSFPCVIYSCKPHKIEWHSPGSVFCHSSPSLSVLLYKLRAFQDFFPSLCVALSPQPPGSNSLLNSMLSPPLFESAKLNISVLPRNWPFVLILIQVDTKIVLLRPVDL